MGGQLQIPFLKSGDTDEPRRGLVARPTAEARRRAEKARRKRGRSFATLIGLGNEADQETLLGGLDELGN